METNGKYPSPHPPEAVSSTTPPRHYKSQLNRTSTLSVKLGRRHSKFHPKSKRPTVSHLNLVLLLHSYLYMTHKFIIFQPRLQRHFMYKHCTQHTYNCYEHYCPSYHYVCYCLSKRPNYSHGTCSGP